MNKLSKQFIEYCIIAFLFACLFGGIASISFFICIYLFLVLSVIGIYVLLVVIID